MAKSKSGGTRTYLRGRVGSDVYSIGRDSKGKKQQVVRSLAESVSNPRTTAQMRGRMILATIAQAVAVLRPIVDHSFDNVVGAQANLSEFNSRNYGLIKADIAANPASGNSFGLVLYKEKGAKRGAYVISDGQATIPSALVLTKASGVIAITLPSDRITIGGLKSALGMTSEEYFTLVGLTTAGAANYERFRVNPTLTDETAISSSNIGDVFAVEGNTVASISIASNVISITMTSVAACCAVIVSKKANGKYIHNEAVLGDGSSFENTADVALPTYPVGAENYLNGGDIFGQSESFNPGGGDTPTPSPTETSIFSATLNGVSLAVAGTAQEQVGNNTVVVNVTPGTDGATYGVAVRPKVGTMVGGTVPAGEQTILSGNSATIADVGVADGGDKIIVLCRNNTITQVWGTITQPASQPSGDTPTLSSATMDGESILDDTQQVGGVGSSRSVVYAGQNLSGCRFVRASVNASVGMTLDGEDIESQSDALSADSGESTALAIGSSLSRIFLVKNNVVVARLAQVQSNPIDTGD